MNCATCKFYEQGETCSYCSHPKATKEEKNYRYYNWTCDTNVKYEEGVHESRKKLMRKEIKELESKLAKSQKWYQIWK